MDPAMPVLKTKLPYLALTACAALAACSVPNSLPRGYVYHDQPYKSPNPPESSKFTAAQRSTMGPEQADQFRLALYSLVEKLTERAGMPPKPVYVLKPDPMTPFYANMDNDLRESLRHIGYRLSDTPEGAYVMAYTAVVAKKVKGAPADDATPNTHLALYVFDGVGENAKRLTQEEGDFYIRGAEELNVRFASFPGVLIPEPTGPGGNFQQ
ncbi:MAG: hypothetical protein DI551_04650 [Micavibrio aeruginosavorus]|uniref:Lipoprotein n=1 Tax=Micavibrio aeruginosavorus TaxID=349221 RepID=A0A2W5N7M5_9BACT|nr:MAG: hypothetical protein DI551_04650 [Micavibrio aeruginosavorus]